MEETDNKIATSKILNILGFYFSELILFFAIYFTGLYRQILIARILSDIAKIPAPTQLVSFLLLIIMTLPILIVLYFINKKFFKLSIKLFFVAHVILLLSIWGLLETLTHFS